MSILISFVITIVFRVFDFVASFLAPQFVRTYNTFMYNNIYQPAFLDSFANFDGIHYMDIAKRAYVEPGEFAFFPFYPLIIKMIQYVTFQNYFTAGLIISFISLTLGLFFLHKYLNSIGLKQNQINWTFIFLLCFPTSFFFNGVYTESLFLLLTVLALYFLKKESYILVMVLGYVAAMTRLVGLFLFVPFIVHSIMMYKKDKSKTLVATFIGVIISPFLGLLTFISYLWIVYGEPLKFITGVQTYGEQRASLFILFPQVMYRYIKIFLTAQPNFQYFIAAVEFVIFTSFLSILLYGITKSFLQKKDMYLAGTLGLFSLINLILPSLTGSFSSIPRYALASLYVFIFLGRIKPAAIKIPVVILFVVFHIILLAYFVQGYFVS